MVVFGILAAGEVFQGIIGGAATFLLHRQLIVRTWLLADHNRGVRAVKTGDHADALVAFQSSARSWDRRAWLDRWRAPLLASASRWGFADQARYNQALCLHALGRLNEAHAILEKQLRLRPNMGVAVALFEHINATMEPPGEAWSALSETLDAPPTTPAPSD
jgi:tetratricopeptide (TPR) repeat protein